MSYQILFLLEFNCFNNTKFLIYFVYRILLDLLKHNISPVAIAQVLKSMVRTKSPNTLTLIPDSSRSTTGSSLPSTKGQYDSTSGLTTPALSSRKGTSGLSSTGGSSVSSSSARSASQSDTSKKGSRIGSGSSSSRSGSARQRGTNDMTGQRQPKSWWLFQTIYYRKKTTLLKVATCPSGRSNL